MKYWCRVNIDKYIENPITYIKVFIFFMPFFGVLSYKVNNVCYLMPLRKWANENDEARMLEVWFGASVTC